VLINLGGAAVIGPAYLVLDQVSSNATLINASGTTANLSPVGSSYIKVLGAGELLAPGASIRLVLQFQVSQAGGISYQDRVFAGGTTLP
jgi:hypothetical protein